MDKKDWVQLLVATCILGTLGFLGVNLFEMKGTLATVDTRSSKTDERVGRIAETLPELKSRVAWEELNSRFEALVLTSVALSMNNGAISRRVALYRPTLKKAFMYDIEAPEESLARSMRLLSGTIYNFDRKAITFSDLTELAYEQRFSVLLPTSLDSRNSFVVRSAHLEDLKKILRNASKGEPREIDVETAFRVIDLSEKLDEIMEK
ncbi:hypothetical protein [Teredinibacter turnerae]|uniref:hypothetical protein n=1 Tax=Teredinibacter turnerae TaxID=2426 RepID=UPI0003742062|nr:hypothetical protein [Teredinibacter turnerae]